MAAARPDVAGPDGGVAAARPDEAGPDTAWQLKRMEQMEVLMAEAIPLILQGEQAAEAVPRNPQWRQTGETVLLNCQQKQTAAWEPQSAGLAHLSLEQKKMQGLKMLGPLAERAADQVTELQGTERKTGLVTKQAAELQGTEQTAVRTAEQTAVRTAEQMAEL